MTNKCYISGKITGLSEDEYMANFHRGKKEVELIGLEPVSPVDLPHEHGKTWTEFMREDLAALLICDNLYALSNWQDSAGARIEVQLAIDLNMTIIYQV